MPVVGIAKIEHHPENGGSPHVVRLIFDSDGPNLWIAYRSREEAEAHLDRLAFLAPRQWGETMTVLRP